MKFKFTNNNNLILESNYCIVTGIFEDSCLFPSTEYINKVSQGYILSLLKRKMFSGLIDRHIILYDAPYFLNKQILIIGCGKKNEFSSDRYKEVITKIIKLCKIESISKVLLLLSELDIHGYSNYWKIRDTIALFNKETYTFNKFKTNTIKLSNVLNEILIYMKNTANTTDLERAISDGLIISRGVNIARDLGNMPANYCTPLYLSDKVRMLPDKFSNLDVEILEELHLREIGMNAYLSVGQGSSYSPVMPIIKYNNYIPTLGCSDTVSNPIVLIGKGLTFDSGGISIKPSEHMDEMKYDMCGAAAVYAIMCIVAELKLPLNIIGILAVSENMINDKSFRPGDIVTTLSGQTVEILNTDAEGRLVLCDILTYVKKYNPSIVIDIATLTGACVVALGSDFSGLMSNNDSLADDLIYASKQTGDYVWRLPLNKIFDKGLHSSCADMTNIGDKYGGGAIIAACFLNKFVHQYKWGHLDIAGTAWYTHSRDKSSTGRPVELLSQFLINQSAALYIK